jgi:hypothetical protein
VNLKTIKVEIVYLVLFHKLIPCRCSEALPEITNGNNVSKNVYHFVIEAAHLTKKLVLGECHLGAVNHIILLAALSAS